MRKLAIGLLAAIGVALAVPSGTQAFTVYVGPHRYHHWHHDWYQRGPYAYDYAPGCRVIVHRHINRWGNRVIVRKRICD